MKIKSITAYLHDFELTRPYTIAYKTHTTAQNVILEIHTDNGKIGLGAASPSVDVTGETFEACLNALSEKSLDFCKNKDITDLPTLLPQIQTALYETPAASAALDMAVHDLYGQLLNKPLVEVLGRAHHTLPTSITIGIKNVNDTLIEAGEYIERGFYVLKVKLGHNVEEDIERIIKLRERYDSKVLIRVDPNQGYSLKDLKDFMLKTQDLSIEFLEQPIKAADFALLRELPQKDRDKIALDESLHHAIDAQKLLTPTPCCGIFNIKLMKCGGIFGGQQIAKIANEANIKLMWGCMDESIISIAAALHVAFASPATRYIDLDGSLDLANDVVTGGFHLANGEMTTMNLPGLGVTKL